MILLKTRPSVLAGGLALCLSLGLASAPAILAQDNGPEDTFHEFAQALSTPDLDALPTFFCAEQASTIGGLDLGRLMDEVPAGLDFLADAFRLELEAQSIEVTSQTQPEALVDIAATLTVDVDIESIVPALEQMLGSLGATEEQIEQAKSDLFSVAPEPEAIDIVGTVRMVHGETMPWVICSDLTQLLVTGAEETPGTSQSPEAAASEEPATTE